MRYPCKTLLVAAALSLGAPVVAFAADRAEMAELPTAAQDTIHQFLEGGQVTKLEKGTKNNAVVYNAEIKKPDGSKINLQVGPDGKLIELKRD